MKLVLVIAVPVVPEIAVAFAIIGAFDTTLLDVSIKFVIMLRVAWSCVSFSFVFAIVLCVEKSKKQKTIRKCFIDFL